MGTRNAGYPDTRFSELLRPTMTYLILPGSLRYPVRPIVLHGSFKGNAVRSPGPTITMPVVLVCHARKMARSQMLAARRDFSQATVYDPLRFPIAPLTALQTPRHGDC